MTDAKDSDHEAERQPIPDEPKLLTLWRRLAALRDALVRQIRQREDEQAYYRRVAENTERRLAANDFDESFARSERERIDEIDGTGAREWRRSALIAGLSDARIAELDDVPLRDRISEIDERVDAGTRDKDDTGRRGITVRQLTDLVEKEHTLAKKAAREAFEEWWDDQENGNKRWLAQVLIAGALGQLEPSVDLDILKAELAKARRDGRGPSRGGAEASGAWIFQYLLHLD